MKKVLPHLLFVAQFAILGLALAFVISLFAPHWADQIRARIALSPAPSVPQSAVSQDDLPSAGAPERAGLTGVVSYSKAVTKAAPAVVSILALKRVVEQSVLPIGGGVSFGPQRVATRPNLGSGVIFNSDGFVMTNYHVIEHADTIYALLSDGQRIRAQLIGTDEETDLAVLRLHIRNLPTIALSENASLQVGDVVLAIGSPFYLSNTVTMGIVSGLGRQLGNGSYEDYIQTDAAINEGNSGGALVNAYGELVGINSSTFTPAGTGNTGIGFAIPVDTVKSVLTQISEHGHVIRGWMGAEYEESFFRRSALDTIDTANRMVVIADVAAGSPAEAAGLKRGDILTSFDGKQVGNKSDLRGREAHLAPGTKVTVAGLRDGVAFKVDLVLSEKPRNRTAVKSSP